MAKVTAVGGYSNSGAYTANASGAATFSFPINAYDTYTATVTATATATATGLSGSGSGSGSATHVVGAADATCP